MPPGIDDYAQQLRDAPPAGVTPFVASRKLPTVPTVTPAEEPQPPAFTVAVAADHLAADLEVRVWTDSDATPPTMPGALAALAAANVRFGIDPARVAAAL